MELKNGLIKKRITVTIINSELLYTKCFVPIELHLLIEDQDGNNIAAYGLGTNHLIEYVTKYLGKGEKITGEEFKKGFFKKGKSLELLIGRIGRLSKCKPSEDETLNKNLSFGSSKYYLWHRIYEVKF